MLGFQPGQRVHDIRTHHGALTMSNRFKHAVIDDVTSRNIDANLQDHLLDLFESAMKSVATTLVREAKFDTTDFATAKAHINNLCTIIDSIPNSSYNPASPAATVVAQRL